MASRVDVTFQSVGSGVAPVIPPFTGLPGIKVPISPTSESDALAYFDVFLPEQFFVMLANETNDYAYKVIGSNLFKQNSE